MGEGPRPPRRVSGPAPPSRRDRARARRFWIIGKLLLPVAVPLLRAWVASWRLELPPRDVLDRIGRAPRIALATYHGMLLHLIAFAALAKRYDRRVVVLASPSRDGRLLAAVLERFGVESIAGSSRSRAVAGGREFIHALEEGRVGLVAVDGPRGPCCVAKPGVLRMARAAGATVVAAVTTAGSGTQFASWDRAHLPWPFARVRIAFREVPDGTPDEGLQGILLAEARALGSPVLPPGGAVAAPSAPGESS
jgi:lysophospholipid acyltransferase (LPLAT)-like uncharacterized protein